MCICVGIYRQGGVYVMKLIITKWYMSLRMVGACLNYCIYPKISVGIYIQGGVYVIKFELLYIPTLIFGYIQ